MVFGLLKKKPRKMKIGYVIIDLTEDGIWVGDKFIPSRSILGIDPGRKVIVYRDEAGGISEVKYK